MVLGNMKDEPASDKVQRIVQKHEGFLQKHHNATKQVYKALAQFYREHPEY